MEAIPMSDTTGGNTVDAHIAIRRVIETLPGVNAGVTAALVEESLEAAGYRVVPADLVTRATQVVDGTYIDDGYASVNRERIERLAASLAAYRGKSPLQVFEGRP